MGRSVSKKWGVVRWCIHFGKRKQKRTSSTASLPPWKIRHT